MSAKQDNGVGLSVNRGREGWAHAWLRSGPGRCRPTWERRTGRRCCDWAEVKRGESGLELGCSGRIQGREGKILFSFSKLVFQTNFEYKFKSIRNLILNHQYKNNMQQHECTTMLLNLWWISISIKIIIYPRFKCTQKYIISEFNSIWRKSKF